jgi:lactam utilization protein B
MAALALVTAPAQASGQTREPDAAGVPTREEQWAARQAEKAGRLAPRQPDALERRLEQAERALFSPRAAGFSSLRLA